MAAQPPAPELLRSLPSAANLSKLQQAQQHGPLTLDELMRLMLPDKEAYFTEWRASLAHPAVCIDSVADIERLDAEDISSLPVPPLLKGVFRELIGQSAARKREQQLVLEATAARAKEFLMPLRDRHMQPPLAGSKYFQDAKTYRLICTREEIEAGVRILARRIEAWSKGERIVLVGILKGAFMLMSDLCRALVRPYSVYFVEASSYKDDRQQGGMAISAEIPASKFYDATSKKPHKIVLIDELLDNGKTMAEMKAYFLARLSDSHSEGDILTACLFSKERPRTWPEADITSIPNLPDLWLVGYGLDDRGTKRGWTELFAIPKVKIVETIETGEVERLLSFLDDGAMLTAPTVFGGFELTYNHKQKYKVYGLDIDGSHSLAQNSLPSLQSPETQITSKEDIVRLLSGVGVVKGKYEREVAIAFIQENVSLVPEDSIFSGNNQLYAELRCRVRNNLARDAQRLNVRGPGELQAASSSQ